MSKVSKKILIAFPPKVQDIKVSTFAWTGVGQEFAIYVLCMY